MRQRSILIWLLAAALFLAACTEAEPVDAEPTEIVLMTHDSFAVSDGVLEAFTAETGITVRLLTAGDAGSLVNQAVLTKDNPTADVLFGIDNTFLSRALDAGLFVAYESPELAGVDPTLIVDPEHRVTPIDFGDVCLNYDKAAFETTPPPATLDDLLDPAYAGQLVVQNPATSSPGLAFLLATIAIYGEEGWQRYWADLVANDVAIAPDWETAYFGNFTGGGGSGQPIVVSYASSPPAAVIFAEEPLGEAPTAVVTDGCFRQIEFAAILRDSGSARELIDFMLSETFQADIPLNMFVFPARTGTPLPPEFVEHTTVPSDPKTLDPAVIEANRDRWIDEWTRLVLP